jgi:hypothetical protein
MTPTLLCDSSVPIDIHSLHYLIEELVRIFQGYSVVVSDGTSARAVLSYDGPAFAAPS